MQTDRQTLLRHIMALPDLPEESVLYLGIDDNQAPRWMHAIVRVEINRVSPKRARDGAALVLQRALSLHQQRERLFVSQTTAIEQCLRRGEVLKPSAIPPEVIGNVIE